MIEAIKSGFAGLVEWAGSLGSRIGSAIGNAARSAIRGVGNFASGVVDSAKSAVGLGGAPAPAVAGKRAAGGPIYGGRSYLVGEQGPEVITAARSGFVHANGAGGSPINPTFHVTNNFHGITDIKEIAGKVSYVIADEIRFTLRGLQADYL
jgi:hypothetical protein